jgi:hypothetical protein
MTVEAKQTFDAFQRSTTVRLVTSKRVFHSWDDGQTSVELQKNRLGRLSQIERFASTTHVEIYIDALTLTTLSLP